MLPMDYHDLVRLSCFGWTIMLRLDYIDVRLSCFGYIIMLWLEYHAPDGLSWFG